MKLPAPPLTWAFDRCIVVCREHGITFEHFASTSREDTVLFARNVATVLLREYPGPGGQFASFPEIAASMGKRNHSTSVTAYRRSMRNAQVREVVIRIARQLGLSDETGKPLPSPIPKAKPEEYVFLKAHTLASLIEMLQAFTGPIGDDERRGRAIAMIAILNTLGESTPYVERRVG